MILKVFSNLNDSMSLCPKVSRISGWVGRNNPKAYWKPYGEMFQVCSGESACLGASLKCLYTGRIWNAVSSSGFPSKRNIWTCWSKCSTGPRRWLRDWSTFRTSRCWESWDCSAWEQKAQGGGTDLVNIYKYVLGRKEEEGAWPSSVAPTSRTRGNGTKWKTWNLSENKKTLFFLWEWLNSGRDFLKRLWSLHLWRYSKPSWMWSWTTCFSWPCFGQGSLTRWLPEILSNPHDSVILIYKSLLHIHFEQIADFKEIHPTCTICFVLNSKSHMNLDLTLMFRNLI